MVCLYCGGSTQVINSRLQKRLNNVWRRRSCTVCKQVFTTLEQPDLVASIRVVTKAGLQPYNRDQLLISVYEACKHRKDALLDARALTQTMTGEIVRQLAGNGTIDGETVKAIIQTTLARFDPIAATVFDAYNK